MSNHWLLERRDGRRAWPRCEGRDREGVGSVVRQSEVKAPPSQ